MKSKGLPYGKIAHLAVALAPLNLKFVRWWGGGLFVVTDGGIVA